MIPRLYTQQPLKLHALIQLDEHQVHYVRNVLRLKPQDTVLLFNGLEGEWSCSVKEMTKKQVLLQCDKQTREQIQEKNLVLIPALIKPARFEILIEKATELGVTEIHPVTTDYTQLKKLNVKRMSLQAIEASEQSERLSVPEIYEPQQLHQVLDHIQAPVFWADESRSAEPFLESLSQHKANHLLIGPEGGFSDREKEYLRQLDQIISVSLGPQILRAETAGIAMVVLYQAYSVIS